MFGNQLPAKAMRSITRSSRYLPRLRALVVALLLSFTIVRPAAAATDFTDLWFTTGYAIGSIAANGETGEPACVDRTCQRPVAALAKGPDGEVWFGGSVIGIFSEPPLAVRLGHSATRVAAGLTTIGFSCHGGAAGDACRGEIRLTASVPRIGGGGIRKVVLDRHRYRLQPATGRRLPLQLGSRGIKALARSKRLVVRVSATLVNGTSSGKRFVLRPRRGR